MFYNVENLFDTIDDKHKSDNDFLPQSKKKWTNSKYQKKLENISKVISSFNTKHYPDIIGLCEVENLFTLEDLVKQKTIKKMNYQIIHYESPDIRGIDNAILFNQKKANLIVSKNIAISFENKKIKTRDILYAKFLLKNNDTIHYYVNHWPSRRGGTDKSEFKRIKAAKTLKYHIDSIQQTTKNANIIICGDFNDYPNNKSVYEILNANEKDNNLINLMYNFSLTDTIGTHYYRNHWGTLDHFIVSKAIAQTNTTLIKEAGIFKEDFMLYTTNKGIKAPSKTYSGTKYYGGYSDHLPIYLTLKIKKARH